jgi:hypothetical protein
MATPTRHPYGACLGLLVPGARCGVWNGLAFALESLAGCSARIIKNAENGIGLSPRAPYIALS